MNRHACVGIWGAWALFFAGCALSVEAEIPDVEITERDVAFPAAPPELPAGTPLSFSFVQEMPRFDLPEDAFTNVSVREVTVRAPDARDLGFIDTLRVTLRPVEGGEGIVLVEYQRPAGAVVGPVLSFSRAPAIDVTSVWRSQSVQVTVEFSGALPTTTWTADVSARYSAKLDPR